MIKKIDESKIVFVIGTSRSGLTPLMDLIAYHKSFAWPSQLNELYPEKFSLSFLSRIVELPFFNSKIKFERYIPKHSEAYSFWNNSFKGFRRPFRDLSSDDVNPIISKKFRKSVSRVMKYQGKNNFIAEYSGWSRIDFLKTIFPNAKFIHIVRDGRAVANSLTNVYFWRGYEGINQWRWGTPDKDLLDSWEKYDKSFLGLAGIQWKILVNNINDKGRNLGDDFLTIRYEDMVSNPHKSAKKCIDFIGLDSDSDYFKKHLNTVKIIDANSSKFRISPWKKSMTSKQIRMLNDILSDELKFFNYI